MKKEGGDRSTFWYTLAIAGILSTALLALFFAPQLKSITGFVVSEITSGDLPDLFVPPSQEPIVAEPNITPPEPDIPLSQEVVVSTPDFSDGSMPPITIEDANIPTINLTSPSTNNGSYSRDAIAANVSANDTDLQSVLIRLFTSAGIYYSLLFNASGTEFPNNLADNTDYHINMTGNVMLLHLNNDSAFTENDTVVYDFSGNQRNGTAAGNATWNFTGKLGAGAFQFNGINGSISLPVATTSTNSTISFWVYNAKIFPATQDALLVYIGNATNDGYGVTIGNGGCAAGTSLAIMVAGSSCNVGGAFSFNSNQWVHVALTRRHNGGPSYTYSSYVNGVLAVSGANSGGNTPSTITLIGTNLTGTKNFNGTIDEVAIWNRTLSASEISNIYYQQSRLFYYNFTNLTNGVYYLNATANDSTGNMSSTETRTITLDTVSPSVNFSVTTPVNRVYLISDSIYANVSSSDADIANLSIYLYNASFSRINSTTGGIGGVTAAATGGVITEYNGYRVHTFTSSGTFNATLGMNIEVLVVGGGGGGGYDASGGGGAGGYVYNTSFPVTAQSNYTVTIGAGGSGGISTAIATAGANSVFSTITAYGGGRGAGFGSSSSSGASGGGGNYAGAGASAIYGAQGNNGGNGNGGSPYPGGGGGGSSSIGVTGSGSQSGDGGNGTSNSINGSAVIYAGGGGGGSTYQGAIRGLGKGGGGDGGGTNSGGGAGTNNTGGGGGGSSNCLCGVGGGNGGSGIVIIKYLIPSSSSLAINFTGLTDGIYYLNATANDTVGNSNKTETRTITLDTTQPAINFTSPSTNNGSYSTTSITANLSSTDANLQSVLIRLYNFTGLYYSILFNASGTEFPNNLADNTDYHTNMTGNVLLFHFNNDSAYGENSTKVYDFSGNQRNGTVTGATWNSTRKLGAGAYQFDGVNDRINITGTIGASPSNGTISLWYKTSMGAYLFDTNSASRYLFYLFPSGGNYFIGWYLSGTPVYETNVPIGGALNAFFTGDWTLLTLTWQGNNQAIYINGNLYGSYAVNINPYNSFANLLIGNRYEFDGPLNGSIDEVAIWNRTLSASEISNIYYQQSRLFYYNFTNLTNGVYYLNATANDTAGNINSTETRVITLDTTAPNVSIISPTITNYNTSQVLISLTNSSDAQAVWWFNGTDNLTYTGLRYHNFSEGSHTIYAYTNDSVGNLNSTSITFVIDTVFPYVQLVSPTPDNNSMQYQEFELTANITEQNLNQLVYNWNGTNYTVYDNSLALWMNFENFSALGENSTKAVDISLSINNGTIYGGVIWNTSGKYGGAYQFDGKNDYVNITDADALTPVNGLTLAAWVRTMNRNTGSVISKYKPDNTNREYDLSIDCLDDGDTGFNFALYDQSQNAYLQIRNMTYTALCDGNWHYLIATWNGTASNSGMKVYDNAVPIGTTTSNSGTFLNMDNGNSALYIGLSAWSASGYYNGTIDEVAIWNRSLSASEIQQIYHSNIRKYDSQNWSFYMNQTNLSSGALYAYSVNASDTAGNSNISERTAIGDAYPAFISISNSPSVTDAIDPFTNITVTANITDAGSNLNSAVLQWRNSTASVWTNVSMVNSTSTIFTANFTTLGQDNYTYRIWAADTIGLVNVSSNTSLGAYWECTWIVTPLDFGGIGGWDENKEVGNLSLNNTGDVPYSNNCTLDFRLTYNLDEGRIYFDHDYAKPSNTYTLQAKTNSTIHLNASFLKEVKEESTLITISEFRGRSSNSSMNSTASLINTVGGPYLYEKITSYPQTLYLAVQNFSFTGYLRNVVGNDSVQNTAYNASFNWSFPPNFLVKDGNASLFYSNISDSNTLYNAINLSFNSTNLPNLRAGAFSVTLNAYGYNLTNSSIIQSGNRTILTETINLTLLCYNVSDGVYVTQCGSLDGDYVPPAEVVTTPTGSSGGGGTSASSTSLSSGEVEKLLSTEANYELVRGKTKDFILRVENVYDGNLDNVTVTVSGMLSQYLRVDPSYVARIPYNRSFNFKIVIGAPQYFSKGEHILNFTIAGTVNKIVVTETGEVVLATNVEERRQVTLSIHELNREMAVLLSNESEKLIEEMKLANLNVNELNNLLSKIKIELDKKNYEEVNSLYEQIKDSSEKAFSVLSALDELEELKAKAGREGLKIPKTERLASLAKVALGRGDYTTAFERAEDAKTMYAIETIGKFNIIAYVKSNWLQLIIQSIILSVIGYVAYLVIKKKWVLAKLGRLRNEESILLGLIKEAQKDCFGRGKMDMKEYFDTVMQYEKKLNKTVGEIIMFETIEVNLFKILKTESSRLLEERKRLMELIKANQRIYLQAGRLDTRVYENKMKSYTERMAEIEERIADLEAKKALKHLKKK